MLTTRLSAGCVLFAVSITGVACASDTDEQTGARAVAPEPVVVADDLNGPMGILVEPDGTVWIVDSGVGGDQAVLTPDPVSRQLAEASFGLTSRIIRVDVEGGQTEFAHLPSLHVGGTAYGGARLAMLDGVLYATSGGWIEGSGDRQTNHSGVVRVDSSQVVEVVNTIEIEIGQNPDPAQRETNPYGLTAGPDGMLWMTDAAGNTLYRVDPESRSLELVTVFEALPGSVPNDARSGALEVEPVPTAVAFMDGEAYVSFLPGLPMAEGTAKVVRVSADGSVTDFATDLTRLTDLQTGPDGHLYAVSMGFPDGSGPGGAVIRIARGSASVTVLTDLPLPTALAFDSRGDAYVAINGVGQPGSGRVLRFPGLVDVR